MKEGKQNFLLEKFNTSQIVLSRLLLNIANVILHLEYFIVQILLRTVKSM